MGYAVYNDLAWVDQLLSLPADYADEAQLYMDVLRQRLPHGSSMLHLGCGAGRHDHHFQRHFRVTGVDISSGTLDLARQLNPDVCYLLGDMRSIRLQQRFDAVVIPDSIMYMGTLPDLQAAIATACAHLQPHGVLLLVVHTKEDFQENNFVYHGRQGALEVTLFENNYICGDGYEATFVYLIRRHGVQEMRHEVHRLGLFPHHTWLQLLAAQGLAIQELALDHLYDRYVMDGQYRLKLLVGTSSGP